MADLQLKGIYKRYAGGVTAVSDFNLDIEDKEFIILVGPSGCGKSTTLRMIAGLEEISEGELYINGKHTETVSGDGLIISTPTGSTSYNLSAGGPVLTPTSQNIVITPVASHSFSNPSIVMDGKDVARVEVSFSAFGSF